MLRKLTAAVFAITLLCAASNLFADEEGEQNALGFTVETLVGEEVELDKYEGKVVLIVNVASRCGLTPQYEQLQDLHEAYSEDGLAVLGFPCNQFAGQEPGTAAEISTFCTDRFGVEFDMFAKIEVNGESACDLYKFLRDVETEPVGAGDISWNFEKFLLNREGEVIARFSPRTRPDDPAVIEMIESELEKE